MKEKKDRKPFVSPNQEMKEMTPTSIVLGILLAVVFGAANAYLGLRVGMTVSASIPAAVLSMGGTGCITIPGRYGLRRGTAGRRRRRK